MSDKFKVLVEFDREEEEIKYYVGKKWFSFFGKPFYFHTYDWWYNKERAEEVVYLLNNPEEFDRRLNEAMETIKQIEKDAN